MPKKKTIKYKSIEIRAIEVDGEDYLALTDIAKEKENNRPDGVIQSWMTNKSTFNFLSAWENSFNTDFKPVEMDGFKGLETLQRESLQTGFILYPSKWIAHVNAKGIISKRGRYGGTFSHSDIAFDFAGWIDPAFRIYLIREFKRLKSEEYNRLGNPLSIYRELSKVNYSLHTEAINTRLIDPKIRKTKNAGKVYASEADLLNLVIFKCSAREWRTKNPKLNGNIRDHATIEELLLLLNLEALNSALISWEMDQEERYVVLEKEAKRQLPVILKSKAIKRIKENSEKQRKLK